MRERAGGVCEGCSAARASDWSHRIAKGRGGLWVASNGLHLCSGCHHGVCHAAPTRARDELGWVVVTGFDTTAAPVWLFRWGWVLLDDEGMVRPTDKPC